VVRSDKYFIVQKFRPSPLPIKGLPLGLRAVGHYNAPPGNIPPVRYSTYTAIAWGIRGSLTATIEDIGQFTLTPEYVLVITPGLKYCLEASTEGCEFRYIAIDGPQSEFTWLNIGLWTGLFPTREAPSGWLDGLAELVVSENREDQILAVSRAHDLVVYQADIAKELIRDNLVYQAQWYIHRNWHNCEVNIESIISFLNVDRATLSTRFKRKTGLPMLEYITRLRIAGAKRMLTTTSMQICEVAKMCGFKDSSYFARLFRKKTGFAPLQYRIGNTRSEVKEFNIPLSQTALKDN